LALKARPRWPGRAYARGPIRPKKEVLLLIIGVSAPWPNAILSKDRGKQRHAREGRDADEDSTSQGEGFAPSLIGHADFCQSERELVAGDGCWDGIEQSDQGADQRRTGNGKSDPPKRQCEAGSMPTLM
jgi:hypothetical protein